KVLLDERGVLRGHAVGLEQQRGNPARAALGRADHDAAAFELPDAPDQVRPPIEDPDWLKEQTADRLDLRHLFVVQIPLGGRGQASLQTAGEAAFQQAAVDPVVVGRERLEDIKALEIGPQLERDAEARKLALPGLGKLLVGAASATGGQYDPAG